MTAIMDAPRRGAGGGARPNGRPSDLDVHAPRLEPDPIPAELLADRPPGELWTPAGVPPCGQWALMRPTETRIGWLVVCPACCLGRCRLLPDPADERGYQLEFVAGCSHGCEAGELAWWLMWRLGEVPPQKPVPPDKRERGSTRDEGPHLLGYQIAPEVVLKLAKRGGHIAVIANKDRVRGYSAGSTTRNSAAFCCARSRSAPVRCVPNKALMT